MDKADFIAASKIYKDVLTAAAGSGILTQIDAEFPPGELKCLVRAVDEICVLDIKPPNLTAEEVLALQECQRRYGVDWKKNLINEWKQGIASRVLTNLRDSPDFGPKGLESLQLPA